MAEWANVVYQWAKSTGKVGGLLTLYDLRAGDDTAGEPFHGLDQGLLLKVLDVLEDEGKARVYKDGDVADEFGVRFYEV